MKLRREVDLQTFREVTKEMDAALDQLDREHKSLTSEAAMPELPDPSLAWEDLSAPDRRALTEMLVDKIIIERHPSKIDKDGRRHYLVRAIPIPRSRDGSRATKEGARGPGSRSSPGSEKHRRRHTVLPIEPMESPKIRRGPGADRVYDIGDAVSFPLAQRRRG